MNTHKLDDQIESLPEPIDMKEFLSKYRNSKDANSRLKKHDEEWIQENLFYIAFWVQVGNYQ